YSRQRPRTYIRYVHAPVSDRMIAEDWLAQLCLCDILYYDDGREGYAGTTLTDYRRGWDDLWLQPNQARLFRAGNFVHIWDDHEYGPNDSDGTYEGKLDAAQVDRERGPHQDLA